MRSAAALVLGLVAIAACGSADDGPDVADDVTSEAATADTTAPPPSAPCGFGEVTIAPHFTGTATPNQTALNCYGWQMFIGLNWPADPTKPGAPDPSIGPNGFGMAGDETPTVWQSYSTADSVFRPNAEPPLEFGSRSAIPDGCTGGSTATVFDTRSKFSDDRHLDTMRALGSVLGGADTDVDLADVMEATHQGLTDQHGNPVFFERFLNEPEYDYITTNQLYDAAVQATFAMDPGIDLPAGVGGTVPDGGSLGSIELKAAWRTLGDDDDSTRFKTVEAYTTTAGGTCEGPFVMGLVGLHIIHKTSSNLNFVWTTFEHVDNAPDDSKRPPETGGPAWSFYNPSCPDPCAPNSWNSPPGTGTVPTGPVQVVRTTPVTATVEQLNTSVQQLIAQANGASVWQHYRLIDVLWDQNSNGITFTGPGVTIPLPFTPLSNGGPVANTTLETYAQTTSCQSCHQTATIAGSKTLASDYSFLFSTAQTRQG